MPRPEKPTDLPRESHYADVLRSKIYYVEHGIGDPVLFPRGQPTWSYLGRHVLPELDNRVLAASRPSVIA